MAHRELGRKGDPHRKGDLKRKGDLPQRTCKACGLLFNWRKKWERDWDRVEYCSDRCRRAGKSQTE